jgi:hypothetical protein
MSILAKNIGNLTYFNQNNLVKSDFLLERERERERG